MKYLLDANAIIAILKGTPTLLQRLHKHVPADFGLPSIVSHESFYGAYKGQRTAENLARIDALRFENMTCRISRRLMILALKIKGLYCLDEICRAVCLSGFRLSYQKRRLREFITMEMPFLLRTSVAAPIEVRGPAAAYSCCPCVAESQSDHRSQNLRSWRWSGILR